MRAKARRWGNSLAIRIPRAVAEEAHLQDGSPVDLNVAEGKIVITPIGPPRFTLDDLLARITDENLHGEASVGPAVGAEAW
ncbi:MAG: AbrB/MazE/SpoVT family DNA-binding domain-containing protein [Chloroflexi bacterium]|nr:AbrB/MazE/SpoVT family DNA-binding domain-containing protein [Chloroflexota bacterium]